MAFRGLLIFMAISLGVMFFVRVKLMTHYTLDMGGADQNVVQGTLRVMLGEPLYGDPEEPPFPAIQYSPAFFGASTTDSWVNLTPWGPGAGQTIAAFMNSREGGTLLIGVAPEGFTTLTPFSDPPPGEVLRLVGIRRDGGPVGVRFRVADLRTGRVVSGNPLVPFTVEGFQTAEVCGASADAVDGEDPSGDGVTEVDEGSTVGSDGGFTPSLGADGSGTRSTTTLDDGTAPLTGD